MMGLSGGSRKYGDLATCLNTQGATGCDAILQLGLVELNLGLKEGGFGTGLGALVNVPVLPQSVDAAVVQSGLAEVDTAYLDLVQAAKRAEYEGRNPLKQLATERADSYADYTGPYLLSEGSPRRAQNISTTIMMKNAAALSRGPVVSGPDPNFLSLPTAAATPKRLGAAACHQPVLPRSCNRRAPTANVGSVMLSTNSP